MRLRTGGAPGRGPIWAYWPGKRKALTVKKVLIVEDQDDIRELIRVTLEFENFELGEAANGEALWHKRRPSGPT